jgi:hypothetical protein
VEELEGWKRKEWNVRGTKEEECSREEKKKHTMWSFSVVHLTGMIAIKISFFSVMIVD